MPPQRARRAPKAPPVVHPDIVTAFPRVVVACTRPQCHVCGDPFGTATGLPTQAAAISFRRRLDRKRRAAGGGRRRVLSHAAALLRRVCFLTSRGKSLTKAEVARQYAAIAGCSVAKSRSATTKFFELTHRARFSSRCVLFVPSALLGPDRRPRLAVDPARLARVDVFKLLVQRDGVAYKASPPLMKAYAELRAQAEGARKAAQAQAAQAARAAQRAGLRCVDCGGTGGLLAQRLEGFAVVPCAACRPAAPQKEPLEK